MTAIHTMDGHTLYQSASWTGEFNPAALRAGALVIQAFSEATGRSELGRYVLPEGIELREVLLDDLHTMSPEHEVETLARASEVSAWAADAFRRDRDVAILCGGGLNRSGLIVGLTLRRLGMSADFAIARIQAARHDALNNPLFRKMITESELPPPRWFNDRSSWLATLTPIAPPAPATFGGGPHTIVFAVDGYTGLDRLYALLPERIQAEKIAKRTGYPTIIIALPTGTCYEVKGGVATPCERPKVQ